MQISIKKSIHKQTIYGAGVHYLRRNNMRYLCMAVQAGQEKKLVRIFLAKKWLVDKGCPPNIAAAMFSSAIASDRNREIKQEV